VITANDVPGTKVPGYFRGVPLGRELTIFVAFRWDVSGLFLWCFAET
jgi:hypothetical protein